MHYFPDNMGLATDLLMHAKTGLVESRNDYIVVQTPDAPDYFFGNMLVLRQRPMEGDLTRLEADFAEFVGTPPLIAHRTFTWPETFGSVIALDAFVEQGYDVTVCRVLSTRPEEVVSVSTNPSVEVRPFAVQQDWENWSRMQLANMSNPLDIVSRRYMAYQQTAYKRLIDDGLGNWWGAFIDGEQVGSLGLFFLDGIGRFQSVVTAEEYRNQKVCKTLVSEVIGLNAGRADRLVMVADETYHAGAIYEAMGFLPQARVASVCREPGPE